MPDRRSAVTRIIIFAATIAIVMPFGAHSMDVRLAWAQNCASCHARDGSGSTMMGKKLGVKDYRDPTLQAAFSDGEAERAIKEGVKTNGKER